jgi:thiol-disulfide isomerase/thioredoxin
MNRIIVFIAGFAVALTALLAGLYASSRNEAGTIAANTPLNSAAIPPGAAAAVFAARLDDLSGQPQALAQWRGKILVVNFWAAWCPPCRDEMPAFSRLQSEYAGRGVQFVGIALDSAENVKSFSENLRVSYPLLLGGEGGDDLARAIGNRSVALPYTLIIDADGTARASRLGYLAERDLEALLEQSLKR